MLGLLINEKECLELNYMLRKEMDEMTLDLQDSRLNSEIKTVIEQRYQMIFRIYARIAEPNELSKYVRNRCFS